MADNYQTWEQVRQAAANSMKNRLNTSEMPLFQAEGFTSPEENSFYEANPNKAGWNFAYQPNGSGGVKQTEYEQQNGIDPALLAMIGAALTAGTLMAPGALGAGAAGAGAEGAGGTGGWLSAEGGAGYAGGAAADAAEMAGAGAGGAGGWTSGADLPSGGDIGSAVADPYANESAKFLQQQTIADNGGDILSTNLPTVDSSGGSLTSDLTKRIAKKLLSGQSGGGTTTGGQSGGYGTPSVSFIDQANQTPRAIQGQAAPQQTQMAYNPFYLSNPEQPKFAQQDPQLAALAKALQEEQNG